MEMSQGNALGKIAIVCPTSSGNAVGRAVCLFLASERLTDTRLFLLSDGPLWLGANGVRRFVTGVTSETNLHSLLDDFALGQNVTLWHVKPFGQTLRWCESYVNERKAKSSVVVDVDDDDVGLGAEFRRNRRLNRMILNPFREASPERIRRTLSQVIRKFPVSTSSRSLDEFLQLNSSLVIPHVRDSNPRLESPTDLELPRFGFFGTLRPHKGLQYIKNFIQTSGGEFEFHFLEDPSIQQEFRGSRNVVFHKSVSIEDLIALYGLIDVVLLPQSNLSSGSRYQFPAKLVDALQFRRVIIATPTPPIMEWAGNAVEPLSDWSDEEEIWRALDSARLRHWDHQMRADTAFAGLTVESQIANLDSFLRCL